MKSDLSKKTNGMENELDNTRTTRNGATGRASVGLKCSGCQRRFPSIVRLKRHLNVIHKNAGKIFICHKCNKTFSNLSFLLQHSKGHKLEKQQLQKIKSGEASSFSESNLPVDGDVDGYDFSSNANGKVIVEEIIEERSFEIIDKGLEDAEGSSIEDDGVEILTTLPANETTTTHCRGSSSGTTLVSKIEAVKNGSDGESLQQDISSANNDGAKMVTVSTEAEPTNALSSKEDATASTSRKRPRARGRQRKSQINRSMPRNRSLAPKLPRSALPNANPNPSIPRPVSVPENTVGPNMNFDANGSLNIGIPQSVKTINLMSSSNEDLGKKDEKAEIIAYLDVVNSKLDSIIRHFNVPSIAEGVNAPKHHLQPAHASVIPHHTLNTQSCDKPDSYQQADSMWKANSGSPSMVFHSLAKKGRIAASNLVGTANVNDEDQQDLNQHQQYYEQSNESVQPQEHDGYDDTRNAKSDQYVVELSEELIMKLHHKSLNRGNFAKHLVFNMFSPEERFGRNCFGRRTGWQCGPKSALDSHKLDIVREIVFQYYPCEKDCEDSVWRRECVIAIDTGLRGEHRTNLVKKQAKDTF
eukprot:gene20008-21969_t